MKLGGASIIRNRQDTLPHPRKGPAAGNNIGKENKSGNFAPCFYKTSKITSTQFPLCCQSSGRFADGQYRAITHLPHSGLRALHTARP